MSFYGKFVIPAKAGIRAFNRKILSSRRWGLNLIGISVTLIFCSPLALGVTGSITDPGFYSTQTPEKSFFGPLRGSLKTRLSRNIRRSEWENFFSSFHQDNIFDTLFIKTDLSLNYPLVKIFPSLKKSSSFNKTLLFFVFNYRRPLYDVPQVIKWYCYQSQFCFGEANLGVSNSLPQKNLLNSQYSVYLNIPVTSKKSYDRKKIIGIGSSLSLDHPLLSAQNLQVSGMSSHSFDIAIYGSRYANEQGSEVNEIFSLFNQGSLRFSYSGYPFIPVTLVYVSHLLALDYQQEWFQGLSLGFSAVWSVGKRVQVVAGLSWGSAIFRHEYTGKAKEADLFNPDETFFNGGFSYAF